jgi:hypothetical protein
MAPLLATSGKSSIKDALEELDIVLHISVTSDLIRDSLPPIEDNSNYFDNDSAEKCTSWILAETERDAEQRVAEKIYETLDEMRCLLKIINEHIAAYDGSWFAIRSLNLDAEISQLERKKRLLDSRFKLLWQILQLKNGKTINSNE